MPINNDNINLVGNFDAQSVEINFMLTCMQKINLITQFFLNILQRNSKLVILGNLCMPGHTHLK